MKIMNKNSNLESEFDRVNKKIDLTIQSCFSLQVIPNPKISPENIE